MKVLHQIAEYLLYEGLLDPELLARLEGVEVVPARLWAPDEHTSSMRFRPPTPVPEPVIWGPPHGRAAADSHGRARRRGPPRDPDAVPRALARAVEALRGIVEPLLPLLGAPPADGVGRWSHRGTDEVRAAFSRCVATGEVEPRAALALLVADLVGPVSRVTAGGSALLAGDLAGWDRALGPLLEHADGRVLWEIVSLRRVLSAAIAGGSEADRRAWRGAGRASNLRAAVVTLEPDAFDRALDVLPSLGHDPIRLLGVRVDGRVQPPDVPVTDALLRVWCRASAASAARVVELDLSGTHAEDPASLVPFTGLRRLDLSNTRFPADGHFLCLLPEDCVVQLPAPLRKEH